jgi:hypothetical protein
VNPGFEHCNRWVIVALIVALLPLAACRGTSDEAGPGGNEPARVEAVEGTDVSRVILTAKAAERLGIRTATVQNGEGRHAELTVIPYSALVYDTNGRAWAYTSPEQLTFVRSRLTVARIEEQNIFLLDGPPPGTSVVTVGAAELYGTELGIE